MLSEACRLREAHNRVSRGVQGKDLLMRVQQARVSWKQHLQQCLVPAKMARRRPLMTQAQQDDEGQSKRASRSIVHSPPRKQTPRLPSQRQKMRPVSKEGNTGNVKTKVPCGAIFLKHGGHGQSGLPWSEATRTLRQSVHVCACVRAHACAMSGVCVCACVGACLHTHAPKSPRSSPVCTRCCVWCVCVCIMRACFPLSEA